MSSVTPLQLLIRSIEARRQILVLLKDLLPEDREQVLKEVQKR